MKITQITVSAGRVIPHPSQDFSNLRPSVSLTATLDDGDDPIVETRALQARCEQLVEDHKDHLIGSIHQLEELAVRDREIRQLEQMITNSQEQLTQLRKNPVAAVEHTPRRARLPRFHDSDRSGSSADDDDGHY